MSLLTLFDIKKHSHSLCVVELWPIIMSPLCRQRWGHIALPMSAQSVWVCVVSLSLIHFSPALSILQVVKHRCWLNAGLMLVYGLQRWLNISPVLGYRVVFGATLNMGQRHRRQGNINPALVQSIMPVLPACRYRQHEVLTRTEWIQAGTSDVSPTFNRHWLVITASSIKQYQFSCYSQQTQNICITFVQRRLNVFDVVPTLYTCYTNVFCLLCWTQPNKHETLNQCWSDARPASQWFSIEPELGQRRVCWEFWQVFRTKTE